jgi:hypothetical protein
VVRVGIAKAVMQENGDLCTDTADNVLQWCAWTSPHAGAFLKVCWHPQSQHAIASARRRYFWSSRNVTSAGTP